ncbi:4Fe-4S dicluster domain-containing protein [Desulfofundulus thermocisternus]|uniref:4Fe-4S dicluster domain-containing protein n=1 Tax=Desulfofundulus thermocisternus TaxID=42471 RepID=UPI0019DF4958|nr:4Fe-4S dicluster domain-containing protein [Desulfofundulus thermocisternus]MBE3585807.1 4Fe-4S dicluster domain-containing protein [Thermoanaerobacter sp.]MCS5696393.1 4Fe-4S dicluster domain-containing protein [Desulfofundulus thermocisternus]
MSMEPLAKAGRELIERIKEISGQNASICMQCGTCSASCTGRDLMDYPPRQVMRMIQLGNQNVLNLKSIWICSTCFICTARCPRGIDIARLMEALRVINLREGREVLIAEKIPLEILTRVPQMALTSGFRKLSA